MLRCALHDVLNIIHSLSRFLPPPMPHTLPVFLSYETIYLTWKLRFRPGRL